MELLAMPNPNSNGHPPAFDVDFAVTPDDKPEPVVDFNFADSDGLPHPSGEGLKKAEMAVDDNGPGILDVCVPDNSGLLDA